MTISAKLIFLCGKMAAGKSTLARDLAQRENAVLLVRTSSWITSFLARSPIYRVSSSTGTIVWSEGFGYTNRSQKVKVTADTLFHVGSISKSFTALGVLKAIDKGLLALDDRVKNHVSWFTVNSRNGPAEAEKITVRHLLSHHSGLRTWSRLGNPSDVQYHARTFDEVVKSTPDRVSHSPSLCVKNFSPH